MLEGHSQCDSAVLAHSAPYSVKPTNLLDIAMIRLNCPYPTGMPRAPIHRHRYIVLAQYSVSPSEECNPEDLDEAVAFAMDVRTSVPDGADFE